VRAETAVLGFLNQVLSLAGEVSQGQLAEILAMDSTPLTPRLRIMVREDWIAERRGRDRRECLLTLAKAGRSQFSRALPAWEQIQARVGRRLGDKRRHELLKFANEIATLATNLGELS
jgi:DNA-binding MarR family transcriptional regulator